MKLKLQVENVQELVPALQVSCVFSQRGGIIGSENGVTWQIQDAAGSVPENAARIVVVDDKFTIESFQDTKVYINGASSPILEGRPVIVSDKDNIRIGELTIRAESASTNREEAHHVHSMSSFAMQNADAQDALVIDGEYEEAAVAQERRKSDTAHDPVEALDGVVDRRASVDPMEALSKYQDPKEIIEEAKAIGGDVTTLPDGSGTHSASVLPRKVKRDRYGFEEAASDWSDTEADTSLEQAQIDLNHPVDHVALRPLSRALGLPLGEMSSKQAANVLSEIGGSLRAAVSGMNEIYRSRNTNSNRFPLTTLHLHAVEDNPLRFSQDTDEALHAMFAKRGAVHLSASAAMDEAVKHFAAHQVATEQAIDKALDAVMTALLPQALERRFRSYAPNERPSDGEERDAWCWGMYKAYFSELRSQRQKGLQMLFWEVFQHEYQSIMRTHELTGLDEFDDA